jgi:hypothetical protein
MKTLARNAFFLVLLFTTVLVFAQQPTEKCGTWRWQVKTLTDEGGIDLLTKTPIRATIDQLVSVQPTKTLEAGSKKDGNIPRYPREKQVVVVKAFVTEMKDEDDRDMHFVLKSIYSDSTMVGEIPDPGCPDFDNFPQLNELFQKTRDNGVKVKEILKKTKKPVKVRITGIPFWDGVHSKTPVGASKYCREIHPIIKIEII